MNVGTHLGKENALALIFGYAVNILLKEISGKISYKLCLLHKNR